MKVTVHVDGGARGNPGPAAAASVVSDPTGEVLDEHARLLGEATNNVAEYRALLLGLERARALGATEVEVVNDSELIAKQVKGIYKVKHAAMRPLHLDAMAALRQFERRAGRASGCGDRTPVEPVALAVQARWLPAAQRWPKHTS
jgi:ribonuclease HI